jgi:hypothetical protein
VKNVMIKPIENQNSLGQHYINLEGVAIIFKEK